MSDAHDLPMGPHNEQAMMEHDVLTSFESYVQAKQELLALLQAGA